jgi:hypothetical protein
MIRLLIKGGVSIAEAELAKRGIPTYDKTWTSASDLGGLMTHTAVPEVYWDKVARWFGEDAKVPFPSGTLLFFTKGNGTAERKTA